MKAWELDEIRRAVKGKWVMRGELAHRFNGRVCTDSRRAAAGDLFIAIKGERFDGHDFLRDVMGREVAVALVSGQWLGASDRADLLSFARDKGVGVIAVEDTIVGLNRLAGAWRANEFGSGFRAKVIAVGGSNGKTTTKRILHALLAEKFGASGGGGGGGGIASPKSFNNNIGMPLTLLEVEPSHDYVVLEIGTNAPGEIAALGEVCRPDIAVIVSVGLEHLEKLGDLAGVAREEAAIGGYLMKGGTLVLPAEAELLGVLKQFSGQRIVVGSQNAKCEMRNAECDLELTEVESGAAGVSFSVNGRGRFLVPLVGEHNGMNALMAIAVARRMGVSDEQIVAGLAKVKAAEGRMEVLQVGQWRVVNDAYNANPSSMEASLRTFVRMTGDGTTKTRKEEDARNGNWKRVVILADMLELGAASEEMHRAVGRLVGELLDEGDVMVAVGAAMGLAADEVEALKLGAGSRKRIEVGPRVVRFKDVAVARREILELLENGDQVLLKGSHGMMLESLLPLLREAASEKIVARTA